MSLVFFHLRMSKKGELVIRVISEYIDMYTRTGL